MDKQYQWKTDAVIVSGGYPDEETGIISGSTDWHTTSELTGTASAEYFFRDSGISSNANSSRVAVGITDSWTASIDGSNNLTINVNTTINYIARNDIRGNPSSGFNAYREMYLRREAGGAILWSVQNDNIDYSHEILQTPLALPAYSFTIAPGERYSRGSVYFLSSVQGHANDPLPNIYTDVMWIGVNFMNILPKDYRPGQRKVNGQWFSLNRSNGVCDRVGYGEMRTLDGGVGTNDPPSRKQNGVWYNMKKIGIE